MEGAEIVVHSGPVEFFEGKTLELLCNLTAGNYVTYKWLLNGQLIHQSPFHVVFDNHLRIYRSVRHYMDSHCCITRWLYCGYYLIKLRLMVHKASENEKLDECKNY